MNATNLSTPKRNSPPLIFVVDDNRELTEMADMILTAEGYQCQAFCDPDQVVEIFNKSKVVPDLLLTDYDMESMNGLELIKYCRQTVPALKAVLMSGTAQAETVLLHPVKVDHFLSKPYQPEQLTALVKSLLSE